MPVEQSAIRRPRGQAVVAGPSRKNRLPEESISSILFDFQNIKLILGSDHVFWYGNGNAQVSISTGLHGR